MAKNLEKWLTGGGLVAAVLSSLCCIGPLILGAIGVSGASTLIVLDEYRGILIFIVIFLIGLGWFMNFRLEKNECKDGSICADPKKRNSRRKWLSLASIVALSFVLSPLFLDSLSQAQNNSTIATAKVRTLYVEGMTCGGCEMGVRKALKRAGLSDEQILSVDHSSPNPENNIGSAVIKIPKEKSCQIITEIKNSPGYKAYWSFENKDPCKVQKTKTSKTGSVDSVKEILSSTYDPQMNKICSRGCAEKSINYKKSDIVPNGNAKIGDVTRCPLSGVVFRVKESTPKFESDGKTFQFCCKTCMAKYKIKMKKKA